MSTEIQWKITINIDNQDFKKPWWSRLKNSTPPTSLLDVVKDD